MNGNDAEVRGAKFDEEVCKQKRYCLVFVTFGCLCIMAIIGMGIWSLSAKQPWYPLAAMVPMLITLVTFPSQLKKANWDRGKAGYLATGRMPRGSWSMGMMLSFMAVMLVITLVGGSQIYRLNRAIEAEREQLHRNSTASRQMALENILRDEDHSGTIPILLPRDEKDSLSLKGRWGKPHRDRDGHLAIP